MCIHVHGFSYNVVVSLYIVLCSLYLYLISAHKCNFPGCNQVFVLDGNMKNRRDVCAASEAGYIQYKSLPGTIKTGCQLSPMRTSKYCFNHAPRVSKVSVQEHTSTSQPESTVIQDGIVKVLLAKKATRNSTLYQVLKL